jgi:hypothetical protein
MSASHVTQLLSTAIYSETSQKELSKKETTSQKELAIKLEPPRERDNL